MVLFKSYGDLFKFLASVTGILKFLFFLKTFKTQHYDTTHFKSKEEHQTVNVTGLNTTSYSLKKIQSLVPNLKALTLMLKAVTGLYVFYHLYMQLTKEYSLYM